MISTSVFVAARRNQWVVSALFFVLAGCGGIEKPKPTELGANTALIGVRSVWSAKIGVIGFALEPKVVDRQIYAASSGGSVAAIDVETGADVWRTNLNTGISAGVGSDGRSVAVVTQDNELVVLEAGTERWRQKLGSVTTTAPLVAGQRVFVLSADRSIAAFDAASGKRLWQQLRSGESLVLGQAGVLTAVGDTLIAGQSGRLVGLNPLNGAVRWDAPVAISRGTNEVERLVDLVSGFSRLDNSVCVRAFQTSVACVDASIGRIAWSKVASGGTGLSGNANAVYGTESDGRILAWQRADGDRIWTNEKLKFRGTTAPLVVGSTLVVGDAMGYLHFLSSQNGDALTRMPTDSSGVAIAPLLAGQTLIVFTNSGGVFAFMPD